jgi:hypothetical protein
MDDVNNNWYLISDTAVTIIYDQSGRVGHQGGQLCIELLLLLCIGRIACLQLLMFLIETAELRLSLYQKTYPRQKQERNFTYHALKLKLLLL